MAKPVLLVHGAFTGSWVWDKVVAELEQRGIRTKSVDLPSRGPGGTLERDAQAVRDALKGFDEPAVLVGHSYGGAVITRASADNDGVAHLVYVCAALPRAGEAVSDLLGRDPEPQGDLGAALEPREDGTATLKREAARESMFNDATDEQVGPILDKMGPHALGTLGEAATGLGWQQHPATYVITLQDKQFSVALQQEFASNVGTVVKVDAGHGPMFTKPAEIAEAIAAAAS
ncbi:alpha/beta fold hydrolase [Rhodococcus sp. T7]|uniref:alpha/beta fold hydrolase n=1 Tax=Rhodococcus sp. T7 TaxID=627444 RepID=UPI00135A3957|nr:alpha/beta hydrolase [Rhodococcus sp. T7]KAF0957816.1 Pyrethroid hydrolase [Rhodococcus sp. T7]KAF0961531.1 Pyrethroid hydrolase [Rhodococcus sp. T7]